MFFRISLFSTWDYQIFDWCLLTLLLSVFVLLRESIKFSFINLSNILLGYSVIIDFNSCQDLYKSDLNALPSKLPNELLILISSFIYKNN